MTGVTTWNKSTVPAGLDGWNLRADIQRAVDGLNAVVPVASTGERGDLAPPNGKYPGMVVSRTDQNARLQTYDGANWNGPATSTGLQPNDANWAAIGGISRIYGGGEFSQLRAVGRLTRTGGPAFNILQSGFHNTFTSMVPAGWRPGQYQDVYASLVDNLDAPQATLQGRLGSDGSLIFRLNTGPGTSITVSTGWKIFIDIGWWI